MGPKNLFADTPPVKLFFLASIPGAVGMLASALYQLIDGIFVGQILGDTPFAALNFAMPFVIINFALADLIGVGSSVQISISLGRGERQRANDIFTCACLLIVAAGVIVGAVLYASAPALLSLMGAEGELARLSAQYLRVYALCSPVTTIVFAMDNFLRICGKIRYSMALNVAMSVASAVLEFLFLFVFRWGIWGAALATCSGMFLCVCAALFPFARGRLQLRFVRPRSDGRTIRQIVACGSPNFLNNIAGRLTSILMNALLLRAGGEAAVSVYGILMYTEGFVQPLLYGMCDSLQPAVGFNWGAGKFSRVRAIERCCYTASAVVSLTAAAVIFLLPGPIAGLFMPGGDGAFLDMAVGALRLFSLTFLTRWASFATQSWMLAIEKPIPATAISLSTAFLCPVVLVAALWPLGLTGLWLNFAGTSFLVAALAAAVLLRFRPLLSRPDLPGPGPGEGPAA